MNLISIPAFQDNYIWVLSENNGRCIIVDPGEAAPVLAAIEEKSLGSYFEWIYKRLMLERVQTDYMYSAEGLKSAEESVEQTIAERKEILVFLSEHADDWKLDGGKLKFESDALLKQYNQLVNNINQE